MILLTLSPKCSLIRVLALTLSIVVFGACSGVHSPRTLPTASAVDLSRYSGVWHEVARLPMWAQRRCVTSTAEYHMLPSGSLSVHNACKTRSGEEMSIKGTATIVDPIHHAKLFVQFDQWAARLVGLFMDTTEGNYWILHVDPDYRMAIVGTPDREYLWILSRTPTLDDRTYHHLIALSHSLGFDTQDLIRSSP